VPDVYSWQEPKSEPAYRASNQDHLGWWAAAAMLVSILLHVVVFFALDQVKFVFGVGETGETATERVTIREQIEQLPMDLTALPPIDDFTPPPPLDAKSLVDEIEILSALPQNLEIDLKPQVSDAEYAVQVGSATASGEPEAISLEISPGLDAALDAPELGRTKDDLMPAAIGQITVDPGSMQADDTDLTKFAEDMVKNGAGGKVEKGSLDGLSGLDDLIGLPPNVLVGKKTMLPSDLLFEFNKYELRESAKFGLQKLGLLIDNNPAMYCWIEGHSDLIGTDSANLELSRRRAEAVKEYLVESMRMDPDKIVTRGFGRYEPIIITGDQKQQAPNRRVEIKMRKTTPTEDQIQIAPPKAPKVEESPPPRPPAPLPVAPPKAKLVTPNLDKAIPVEIVPAPRAKPIEEPPAPKALPVEPEPAVLRALPVTE